MGAVLHTLNIRLFPEQLTYIVNHAKDQLVFARRVAARGARAPRASSVETTCDASGSLPNASYEELLAEQPAGASTSPSSTTARPPASVTRAARPATRRASSTRTARTSCTRSASASPTASAIREADRVLPVVPMFHANAWGFPYAARMAGARPGHARRFLQAEPLARLIERERVTIAGAVPTIWMDLLRYAASTADLSRCAPWSAAARRCRVSLMERVRGAPRRARSSRRGG